MSDDSRWKGNSGSARKFNDQFEVPEDQVPTFCRVEVAEGGDATPAKRKICEVAMFQGAGSRPEVEGGGGPNAIVEVALEFGI